MKKRLISTKKGHNYNSGEIMNTILAEGDNIKKAIQWIEHEKNDQPQKKIIRLIDEAGMNFNLSPKDSDFLFRFYTKKNE